MSEFQVVAFRAVDLPVSDEKLAYMHAQSSRAKITPWSFDNEYYYGDFGGNAAEMLRRGYDLHLHYANFGTRTLMIRLPHGLPDPNAAKPYLDEGLQFLKDKRGDAGILCIEPYYEPDHLEELWDISSFVDRLLPLRAELIAGDLRPLYVAHLAIALDSNHNPESVEEGPVPAGLGELSSAQTALAEIYGIDEHLLEAAARNSPAIPPASHVRSRYADWLRELAAVKKDAWLARLMGDSHATVRGEMLGEFHRDNRVSSWPTAPSKRTIAELVELAQGIQREKNREKAEKARRERARRLAQMAADPTPALRETERLVTERSIASYRKIADLLAEMREALAGGPRSGLPEEQARKLQKSYPNLRRLISSLREHGFLTK